MKSAQLDMGLVGGAGLIPELPLRQAVTAYEPIPPGPYSVGLTHWISGDGEAHDTQPYTILCGDGRAIAGHVESRQIAETIAEALNACLPDKTPPTIGRLV